MKKELKVRFSIPKSRIKNANTPMNYIVSATKTVWIRKHSLPVWEEALLEQHNLKALEPVINDKVQPNKETQETTQIIEKLKEKIEEAKKELKNHEENNEEYTKLKKERGVLRRKKNKDLPKIEKLTEEIKKYDDETERLKNIIKRRTQTWRNVRDKENPKIKKELRRVESQNNQKYIQEKIKINRFQHLFEECFIVIRVHNITNRDFDAPNFYPTVKAIIDAGTDTGILWEDDNNNIIKSTIFLPGTNIDRDNYIFDITISNDFTAVSKFLEENSNE